MLVLTRKAGEKIRVGDDVVITILHSRGGRFRVGIEAPEGVRILRGELEVRQTPTDMPAGSQPQAT